jgi:CheY-like chemotaxis protein
MESEKASTASKARVLVVDDSSLVRLYCRGVLEKAGFEVEQAINGIEALEKVLTQTFDLVIVDVNMPRMDGFSFLRALRGSAPYQVFQVMAHGGKRVGSGRPQGAENKVTTEARIQAEALGIKPLEVMLEMIKTELWLKNRQISLLDT